METVRLNEHDFVTSEEFRETVGMLFRLLHPFTDEDVEVLTNFYRELWFVKNRNCDLHQKRLEFLQLLKSQNREKIFEQKLRLLKQLGDLELLAGSSPSWVPAESI